MQDRELNLQIFQGAGFQRGGIHALSWTAMTQPGFHAGGVYLTQAQSPSPLAPK